jgi:hypothetical protein
MGRRPRKDTRGSERFVREANQRTLVLPHPPCVWCHTSNRRGVCLVFRPGAKQPKHSPSRRRSRTSSLTSTLSRSQCKASSSAPSKS